MKWVANIYQKYEVKKAISLLCDKAEQTTQIISLSVIAESAQAAVNKADEWLKASKIEDAYVKGVYRVDIQRQHLG